MSKKNQSAHCKGLHPFVRVFVVLLLFENIFVISGRYIPLCWTWRFWYMFPIFYSKIFRCIFFYILTICVSTATRKKISAVKISCRLQNSLILFNYVEAWEIVISHINSILCRLRKSSWILLDFKRWGWIQHRGGTRCLTYRSYYPSTSGCMLVRLTMCYKRRMPYTKDGSVKVAYSQRLSRASFFTSQ